MRKLEIDMGELVGVHQFGSWDLHNFLDVETGRIVLIDDTMDIEVDRVREALDDEPDREAIDIAAMAKELGMADWVCEYVADAFRVEAGYGKRYIPVPEQASNEDYRSMQSFILTVEDDELRDRLDRAIHMRKPFRQFKDVLNDYTEERERWHAYDDACARERILAWLEDEGIEPVEQDRR